MRLLTTVLAAYLAWAALTHPTPEIRYTYPHHATINTQEGDAP